MDRLIERFDKLDSCLIWSGVMICCFLDEGAVDLSCLKGMNNCQTAFANREIDGMFVICYVCEVGIHKGGVNEKGGA